MLEGANIKLSGMVSDINGKSARSILEYLLTGESIDSAKYDEMYEQKVIAHNLKAIKEQIIDDLNCHEPSPAQDDERTPCPSE